MWPDRPSMAGALSTAALVLAVTSRGDAVVLAVVLVLLELRPAAAVAVATALAASSWRWGTTSLDALAGAQSVLGVAATVGPAAAATASWLAAGAVLLAMARDVHPVRLAAVGATVAALLAGPGHGGGIAVRAAVALVAAGLSLGVVHLTAMRPRLQRGVAAASVALGIAALAAAARNAPGWPPDVDVALVRDGTVVSVAVTAAVLAAAAALEGARWSEGWVPPRLRRADRPDSTAPSSPR